MAKKVREPIQVYLTAEERAALDRAARELGVSRSEALRRGISAMRDSGTGGALRDLADAGYVTPAATGPAAPPPSRPVARFKTLLAELARDRGEQ
ncbi:MAG TPA: CopG family transcriptional regulator [Gemmatimonadaceae bacterium]|nr:CopG family transcriptional regulator [Gemmatimonadaceae bacterium]